jgi:spore maturation protein CgeB
MRTFELAAVGACILADDTSEHRALFGPDGEAVAYVSNSTQAAARCRELLNSPAARQTMTENVRRLISQGRHTYAHRLSTLLDHCRS